MKFLIRFALGGLVTAGAAVLAKKLGASFGGLFLAFPSVLVASTTLVERHENKRKRQKGFRGFHRGWFWKRNIPHRLRTALRIPQQKIANN